MSLGLDKATFAATGNCQVGDIGMKAVIIEHGLRQGRCGFNWDFDDGAAMFANEMGVNIFGSCGVANSTMT